MVAHKKPGCYKNTLIIFIFLFLVLVWVPEIHIVCGMQLISCVKDPHSLLSMMALGKSLRG